MVAIARVTCGAIAGSAEAASRTSTIGAPWSLDFGYRPGVHRLFHRHLARAGTGSPTSIALNTRMAECAVGNSILAALLETSCGPIRLDLRVDFRCDHRLCCD